MITRRNWLLRCSILINIAVLLYICSHVIIGNGNVSIGPSFVMQDDYNIKPQHQQQQQQQAAQIVYQEAANDVMMQVSSVICKRKMFSEIVFFVMTTEDDEWSVLLN